MCFTSLLSNDAGNIVLDTGTEVIAQRTLLGVSMNGSGDERPKRILQKLSTIYKRSFIINDLIIL